MIMQLLIFTTLLATLAIASARDTGKFMKTVPTISNSLVNLGKMEISFHFNGKHQEVPSLSDHNVHSDYFPQPAVEEPCPCNNFKPSPFFSDPTEIINKILKSNDFFKDPTSSTCCESSEHLQESSVVFEVNPNNLQTFAAPKASNNVQALPNILRAPLFPSFLPMSAAAGGKQKAVEILLFPTKKNDMTFDFANFLKPRKIKETTVVKSDLQLSKDKVKLPSASVKKDLTFLEKKTEEAIELPKEELQTDAPPVSNVMNSL